MKAYIIKDRKRYLNCKTEEWECSPEKATLFFNKKAAEGNAFPPDGEEVIKVDVRVMINEA